jgi:hypothetical protein
MTRRVLFVSVCAAALLFPAVSGAQPPPPAPVPLAVQPPGAPKPPAAPPPPAPSRREGQPVNVKVDLTILDQRGSGTPTRKTVSVVVADNMTGFIRTRTFYTNAGRVEEVPLNVDVDPTILSDGKIRLRIGIQYDLPGTLAVAENAERPQGNLFTTQLRENLAIIVENGKSIVAAQSAEPVGDRQVTIEVKATILR